MNIFESEVSGREWDCSEATIEREKGYKVIIARIPCATLRDAFWQTCDITMPENLDPKYISKVHSPHYVDKGGPLVKLPRPIVQEGRPHLHQHGPINKGNGSDNRKID